jgi:hypothetical protein
MFKQYLPTYIRKFENNPGWQMKKSSHYVFYYFKNSEAEKDIKNIVKIQENSYKKIIKFLSVPAPKKPIKYFFYPDKKTKKELMGDNWYAQSIYDEFCVHVLYTKKDKPIGEHEDAHLLSLPWGLSIGFFQEGLVEYMVGHAWDGVPHLRYVKNGYKNKIFPKIRTLFKHSAWMKKSKSNAIYFYSLAGAFAAFLINKFGKEKFKRFYKKTDRNNSLAKNIAAFQVVYAKNPEEMENLFKKTF